MKAKLIVNTWEWILKVASAHRKLAECGKNKQNNISLGGMEGGGREEDYNESDGSLFRGNISSPDHSA